MKGVIVKCVEELIKTKFGQSKWEEILEKTGLDKKAVFVVSQDVPDETIMKVIDVIGKVLGLTRQQVFEAFADYWTMTFAPKVYPMYYKGKNNAKEFILAMDKVHENTAKTVPGAKPPRFDYEWKDDKTLIMTYKSHRNLLDLVIALVQSVGKYYKENLKVTKMGANKVEIQFSK